MKEIKDYQLKVRLTQKERETLHNYAEAHSMTISEVVRKAIFYDIHKEE